MLNQNNPGNIRVGPTKWQGLAAVQSGPFCTFISPQYGIRAMERNLLSYKAQGCDTVRAIISRWSPPSDNNSAAMSGTANTEAYIGAITTALRAAGVIQTDSDEIDLDMVAVALPFCKAMTIHENGSNPWPDSVFLEGLKMAGVVDAQPPLMASNTFKAQVGTGVAVVSAAAAHASQYAPTVKGWADQLGDYAGVPIVQHAITVMLTVGAGLVGLGILSQILKQKAA